MARSQLKLRIWGQTGLTSALLLGGLLAGCAGPDYVTEHPVQNMMPPIKAGVFSVSAVDKAPVATHEVEPDYPYELGAILTGKALVVFTVKTDGKVADASVVSADDVLYGEAAVRAVSKWKFNPALLKGAPVDCRLTLPFIFDSPWGYDSRDTGGSFPAAPSTDGASTKDSIERK